MKPAYNLKDQQVTAASPASSSMATASRSPLPTRPAATAPVRRAATCGTLLAVDLGGLDQAIELCTGPSALGRAGDVEAVTGQYAGAGQALCDDWAGLSINGRRSFAAAAPGDLAQVFTYADLHRHDVELLAGFLANGIFSGISETPH